MIQAFSKILNKSQQNYSVSEKELLAITESLEYFRHYLLVKEFELQTDHKALEFLSRSDFSNRRIARWVLKIQEYQFVTKFVPGEQNIADGISRAVVSGITNKEKIGWENLNQKEKYEILMEYHEKSGNGKFNTMKFLIQEKWQGKHLSSEIKNFLLGCLNCLKEGKENKKKNIEVIKTSKRNELWALDLMGKFIGSEENISLFLLGLTILTSG